MSVLCCYRELSVFKLHVFVLIRQNARMTGMSKSAAVSVVKTGENESPEDRRPASAGISR